MNTTEALANLIAELQVSVMNLRAEKATLQEALKVATEKTKEETDE